MLDNFNPKDLKDTVEKLKKNYPNSIIEASGGINEKNIVEYYI